MMPAIRWGVTRPELERATHVQPRVNDVGMKCMAIIQAIHIPLHNLALHEGGVIPIIMQFQQLPQTGVIDGQFGRVAHEHISLMFGTSTS